MRTQPYRDIIIEGGGGISNIDNLSKKELYDLCITLRDRLEDQINENFNLAAYQCDKPYSGEYGDKECGYQHKVMELTHRIAQMKVEYTTGTSKWFIYGGIIGIPVYHIIKSIL